MSIYRSEDMGLFILSIEKNFAWTVMDTLGRLSCLQFIEGNAKEQVYNKPYSTMLRRCDESVRRIRYIESLCEKYNKKVTHPSSVETFLANLQQSIASQGLDAMAYFEKQEQMLEKAEKFCLEQRKEAESSYARYLSIVQHRYVLNKASEIVLSRVR